MQADPVNERDTVAVRFETRIFGALQGTLTLPTGERKDADPGVDWRAELVYPGLRRGERLRRETTMPERATIQARDGTPIAEGPERTSELGPIASEIAGNIGPAPPELAAQLEARGVPAGAPVGLTGLEREFDERLRGHARRHALRRRPGRSRSKAPDARPLGPHHDRPEDRSAPRSRRSPAATAGSRSCARATARCWRWPGSPSRRRSRRAARSRS